jgi:hypothetical protein
MIMDVNAYRIYLLDHVGRIRRSDLVEAEGDDDAVAKVRAMELGVNVEVWLLNRKVALVCGRRDLAAYGAPDPRP